MREMHNDEKKAWKDKTEVLARQFRERIAKKEEELEESVREIRESVLSRRRAEEKEFEEHQRLAVRDARETVPGRRSSENA